MYEIKYRIKALEPLIIAAHGGKNFFVETKDYLPGPNVLGTLAGFFLAQQNLTNHDAHLDTNFRKFFLSDAIRFSNAYAVWEYTSGKPVRATPNPFVFQAEKNVPTRGFNLVHGNPLDEADTLVQTKPLGNYGILQGMTVDKIAVKKSLQFHHERDRKTGIGKKGVIFNYESIEKEQAFEGFIRGSREDLEEFLNFFKPATFETTMGKSRGSQYGKIEFKFLDNSPSEVNIKLPTETDLDYGEYTLSFLSDVILYDDNGFSTNDVNVLENYLRSELDQEVTLTRSFSRAGVAENYNSAWKMKRPAEVTFRTGSCFVISSIPKDKEPALVELQKNGLGERRNEGFGEVDINYAANKISAVCDLNKQFVSVNRPTQPLPAIASTILKKIIKESLLRSVRVLALTDEKAFSTERNLRGLSKSSISRIESFLSKDISRSTFIQKLEQLRKTAREKLEKSSFENKSFYQFLLDKNITSKDLMNTKKQNGLNVLRNELDYAIDFEDELYGAYFKFFLSALRKSLKAGGN